MSFAERDALISRVLGQEWPHEPLLNHLNLSGQVDVLDVGAGEGNLLRVLKSRGHTGKLVGLDPNPGSGIQAGEAERLPFPVHSFDGVFMVRMLSHCTNPIQAIREAKRVLRSEGRICIAVHGKEHLRTLLGVPARGAEDDVQDSLQLAGMDFRRLDVKHNIALLPGDAQALLASYGRPQELTGMKFPLRDTLHLAVFQA